MSIRDDSQQQRDWLLEQLPEVVMRLASPADVQIAYFRRLGPDVPVDELALEFDDLAEAAFSQKGFLRRGQRSRISALDDRLKAMSGADERGLWTEAALRSSNEWREVRTRAEAALRELREGWKPQE